MVGLAFACAISTPGEDEKPVGKQRGEETHRVDVGLPTRSRQAPWVGIAVGFWFQVAIDARLSMLCELFVCLGLVRYCRAFFRWYCFVHQALK